MTVNEKTICKMIQAFPVLLIMAQRRERCLDTPFMYTPPHPTHSTDYYEALEALFHSIYHQTEKPEHSGYNCDSYHSYGKGYYGPSFKPCHGYQHHFTEYPYYTTPTYPSSYPHFGTGHHYEYHNRYPDPNAGTIYGINTGHNFNKAVHNKTPTGQKNYAPTHVYTGSPKIKFKVVVKKNKIGHYRPAPEKLHRNVTTDLNVTLSLQDPVSNAGVQKLRKESVPLQQNKKNRSSKNNTRVQN